MELIMTIGPLILLALAAPRWGRDSRRLLEPEGWLGDPDPRPAAPPRARRPSWRPRRLGRWPGPARAHTPGLRPLPALFRLPTT